MGVSTLVKETVEVYNQLITTNLLVFCITREFSAKFYSWFLFEKQFQVNQHELKQKSSNILANMNAADILACCTVFVAFSHAVQVAENWVQNPINNTATHFRVFIFQLTFAKMISRTHDMA